MKTKSLTFFGAMTLFVTFGTNAQTPEWKTENQIIKFDAASPPNSTQPRSIDTEGQITGILATPDNTNRGFLRSVDGTISIFDAAPGIGTISGEGTTPQSINARGETAGGYIDHSTSYGFLREKDGSIVTLDLSASGTGASSINARGEITGNYSDASFTTHGFLRDRDGTITTFDATSEAIATVPVSVNSEAAIAGYYYTEADVFHGFVRQKDGTIATFDAPGACSSCQPLGTNPTSINDRGEITGFYGDSNGQVHAFLRARDGTITTFNAPDGSSAAGNTFATSINSSGKITGYSSPSSIGVSGVGFLRDKNGKITTFAASPYGTYPSSINDAGEITGDYNDENGILRGFLRKADAGSKGDRESEGRDSSDRLESLEHLP
jgi:hypothetical protein